MANDIDVRGRVLEALQSADEPLSPGGIQRRISKEGVDVAASAIRSACEDLLADGEIETAGDESRPAYRLAE